ncbi:hypothetical protein VNO77_15937 [Canavalia gladiata]|uniref:Uncharacterized protein n=1 Tax=Canavalia gladiata TaxID=3824 RepID=A0AAN9QPH1_CANGL
MARYNSQISVKEPWVVPNAKFWQDDFAPLDFNVKWITATGWKLIRILLAGGGRTSPSPNKDFSLIFWGGKLRSSNQLQP